MNHYDKIEEELKEKESEQKKAKYKVSGRSVFKLKDIIVTKAEELKTKDEEKK